MISIGIGSNLPSATYGEPLAVCEAAVAAIERAGIWVVSRSRWYESAPIPPSDQPLYINGVVRIEPALGPVPLLQLLHGIEADFGRVRTTANAARILDLDLLTYDNRVMNGEEGVILPHPRLSERAFVLLPLAEIAPDWRHPGSGLAVSTMISRLSPDQSAHPVQGGNARESF